MNMTDMFRVQRTKQEPYFEMEKYHYHNVNEIYYLFSGSRKFFISDSIYQIGKGDLVLIRKNELHKTTYVEDKPHERMYVLFSDYYINELEKMSDKGAIDACFDKVVFHIPSNRRRYVEELLGYVENEYNTGDSFSPVLISGYITELLVFLLRYSRFSDDAVYVPSKEDSAIQRAASYMLNNYNTDITLTFISGYVNMSASYFSKKFKETTGFGFKEYLLSIRIKKAAEMLLESKKPITEVAFACGFNDSNYFGDVFKKIKGVSPLQYRKNNDYV